MYTKMWGPYMCLNWDLEGISFSLLFIGCFLGNFDEFRDTKLLFIVLEKHEIIT